MAKSASVILEKVTKAQPQWFVF